jgi:sporulation protein YlmC with PRC-barrel domain
MAITENNRLEELSGSKFEIVAGQPDIRHWKVEDLQGRKIGKVEDLLFNPQSRKVRYLVINLSGNTVGITERKVLFPIGIAILHEKNDTVLLPEITPAHISALPFYEKGVIITPETEMEIRHIFLAPGTQNTNDGDFYGHDQFNQDKFYGPRYPGNKDL